MKVKGKVKGTGDKVIKKKKKVVMHMKREAILREAPQQ